MPVEFMTVRSRQYINNFNRSMCVTCDSGSGWDGYFSHLQLLAAEIGFIQKKFPTALYLICDSVGCVGIALRAFLHLMSLGSVRSLVGGGHSYRRRQQQDLRKVLLHD